MIVDANHLHLSWLADHFRAQATLGLHYFPDDDDRSRFEQLRRNAAELVSLADPRETSAIELSFSRDKGIHTPKAALAFHITGDDGECFWRTAYLAPNRQLPDAVATTASRLDAAPPTGPAALTDSHTLGLPDPHTYLLVYAFTSPRSGGEIRDAWPEPDTALQLSMRGRTLTDLPDPLCADMNPPIVVSPAAAAICREIAAMAAKGMMTTSDPYNIERFEHLRDLASGVTVQQFEYERFGPFALNPSAAATGAEVAIRDGLGRVLLIRRSDTGQWAMPGGACEVGESWAAAAAREAREEIGLEIDPATLQLVQAFDNRFITAEETTIPVIAVFTAEAKPGRTAITMNREVTDTAWVGADELEKLDLFPGHRTKIAAVMDYFSLQLSQ